jgi:hypothetical protein
MRDMEGIEIEKEIHRGSERRGQELERGVIGEWTYLEESGGRDSGKRQIEETDGRDRGRYIWERHISRVRGEETEAKRQREETACEEVGKGRDI